MKVLQVVGTMNVGGAETMLMNLYRNIDRKKIQFDFLEYTKESSFYDEEIEKLGGKVIRISSPQEIGMIKSIFELKTAIEKNGPYDVVHAHTLFNSGIAMIAAKMCNVKIRIVHAHTNQETQFGITRKIYYWWMQKIIVSFSTKFIGASNLAGEFLFGKKICNTQQKYHFLPNFIDYQMILNNYDAREKIRKEFQIKNNELVIGNIGRLIPLKNHKFLLKLAKEIKEIEFRVLIVGDGRLKDELDEEIKKLGLEKQISITGYRKDVSAVLSAMDVFLLPSLFEGFGMAAVEAQVAGLPTIVTDTLPQEIDLDIGLLEKESLENNASEWINKIINCKNKKIYDKEKVINALEKKGYTKEKIIKKVEEIYEIK